MHVVKLMAADNNDDSDGVVMIVMPLIVIYDTHGNGCGYDTLYKTLLVFSTGLTSSAPT